MTSRTTGMRTKRIKYNQFGAGGAGAVYVNSRYRATIPAPIHKRGLRK